MMIFMGSRKFLVLSRWKIVKIRLIVQISIKDPFAFFDFVYWKLLYGGFKLYGRHSKKFSVHSIVKTKSGRFIRVQNFPANNAQAGKKHTFLLANLIYDEIKYRPIPVVKKKDMQIRYHLRERRYKTSRAYFSSTWETYLCADPRLLLDTSSFNQHISLRWRETYESLYINFRFPKWIGYFRPPKSWLIFIQVTWIRPSGRILAVGEYTYVSDLRFEAMHSVDTSEWVLRLRSVQLRDQGDYECQIATKPIKTFAITLKVVGKLKRLIERLFRKLVLSIMVSENLFTRVYFKLNIPPAKFFIFLYWKRQ